MRLLPFITFCACFVAGINLAYALVFIFSFLDAETIGIAFYHQSSNGAFYIIYFLFPVLMGLFLFWIFRQKSNAKWALYLFILVGIAQLCLMVYYGNKNNEYWGYFLKRPIIFNEVTKAESILRASYVYAVDSNGKKAFVIADSSKREYLLMDDENGYYNSKSRIYLTLTGNAHRGANLYSFKKILLDSSMGFGSGKLTELSEKIHADSMIPAIYKAYSSRKLALSGSLTEFETADKTKYIYVGLSGGELSNDHHPFYEFLFRSSGNELILKNKQVFYTDFAGIEGVEMIYLIPFFSFVIVLFSLFIYMIISLIRYFQKRI